MIKFLSTLIMVLASSISFATVVMQLDSKVFENDNLPFISHRGMTRFETTLAMNVQHEPIKALRNELSFWLQYDLNFFTGWNPNGEAHITVVTPVEYYDYVKDYVSMDRIEEIAQELKMQETAFRVLGLGRGQALKNNKIEETYFVIVEAPNLVKIRQQIYKEYLANGGPTTGKSAWNVNEFYPHITVGYSSSSDLHISDGVIKDVNHSLDQRFRIQVQR